MNRCCVYKYVYNNNIIYVGKSDNSLRDRLNCHKKETKFQPYLSKSKIYYAWLANPAMTTILETYLINKYKPKLNVVMKYDYEIPFDIPEPLWKLLNNSGIQYYKYEEKYYPIKNLDIKFLESQLKRETEQRAFFQDAFNRSIETNNHLLQSLDDYLFIIRQKNKHIAKLEDTIQKSFNNKVKSFFKRIIKE